jgi:cytochrome c
MTKASDILVMGLSIFYILFSFTLFSFSHLKPSHYFSKNQTENHAPVVKIISPKNNSIYSVNSQVPYEIRVSDKEDGDSKYQEINTKEVFLEIKYTNDTAKALEMIQKNEQKNADGLSIIKASNCMNCHAFKTKLIGPSFYDITHRYKLLSNTQDTLINHILNGSKGRWGNVQMPSNNKLNADEARNVIHWLFKNAGDSTVTYLAGTEGALRLTPSFKNVILIASYTDHGTKENRGQNLRGEDRIIIQIR